MVGLVGLLALSPSLLAAPRDVIADYFKDGRIDYGYSVQDLRGALVFARGRQGSGPQYAAFADAVNQAITDGLVGSGEAAQEQLTTPRSRTEVAPMPEPAPENLPAPPSGSPAEAIPWVVPTMAIVAAILVLAGIGSSIWRRVRR